MLVLFADRGVNRVPFRQTCIKHGNQYREGSPTMVEIVAVCIRTNSGKVLSVPHSV